MYLYSFFFVVVTVVLFPVQTFVGSLVDILSRNNFSIRLLYLGYTHCILDVGHIAMRVTLDPSLERTKICQRIKYSYLWIFEQIYITLVTILSAKGTGHAHSCKKEENQYEFVICTLLNLSLVKPLLIDRKFW